MLTRLIAIAIAGVVLTGYAPRSLSTSEHAWIIWAIAAGFVFWGPRLLRSGLTSAVSRVHALSRRRPAVDAVHREALKPAS